MYAINRWIWSVILILAVTPAIALMWFVEATSPSSIPPATTTESVLGVLLAVALSYACGLLVSFLFVLVELVTHMLTDEGRGIRNVFNELAPVWPALKGR